MSNPNASFDFADCNGIGGWALDQANLSQPVLIDIYVDGVKTYAGITASDDRQDLVQYLGASGRYHGFSYSFPANAPWKNGQNHTISVRICGVNNDIGAKTVNGCTGGTTTNPPTKPPIIDPSSGSCSVSNPNASFDFADCNGIGGWALDQANLNQPVLIDVYVDGVKTYAGITANKDRQDLVQYYGANSRYHGFSYSFPANAPWKNDQNHTISVRICGVNNEIGGSPKTVGGCTGGTVTPTIPTTNPPIDPPSGSCSVNNPNASFDFADCNGIGGWALDQANLNQPVLIDIYVNGVKTYAGITANGDRQDLVQYFGANGRYHGFNYSFPADAPWKNGQNHSISVRICGVNNEIGGSPKTVSSCTGGTTTPTTPTTNPPSGNCGYTEGQFLLNWYGEQIYTHYYNGILFASYQDPSQGFKPQSWLQVAGFDASKLSCFATIDPHTDGYYTSTNPSLTYYPSYDDDYDQPSFSSTGGLGNSTVNNSYLPSSLTPYTADLQQVFTRGLSIDKYYENELQTMANTILNKLGLTSINQLEQPPFLPIFQLDGLNQMIQVSREYIIVKLKNPTWSNNRCLAVAYMNYCLRTVHIVLDVAGLIPGAGEFPDAINGGIYLLEGDKTNAALSFAATMPIAGWVATSSKYAKSGLQAIGASKFISAEGLIWANRTYVTDSESLHALNHVYQHFKNASKNYHGIFNIPTNELIGLIDAAWSKVKSGSPGITRTVGRNGNVSYSIPMGTTIGVQGGTKGSGKALDRVNIVIDGNNPNHIVTAFPE